MVPRVMACPSCNLRIETEFSENEFVGLEEEWLHFLRIFVHCQGRITDMEAALGISYPTVKARVAELKQRLGLQGIPENPEQDAGSPELKAAGDDGDDERAASVSGILDAFDAGEIDYDEAMDRIAKASRSSS